MARGRARGVAQSAILKTTRTRCRASGPTAAFWAGRRAATCAAPGPASSVIQACLASRAILIVSCGPTPPTRWRRAQPGGGRRYCGGGVQRRRAREGQGAAGAARRSRSASRGRAPGLVVDAPAAAPLASATLQARWLTSKFSAVPDPGRSAHHRRRRSRRPSGRAPPPPPPTTPRKSVDLPARLEGGGPSRRRRRCRAGVSSLIKRRAQEGSPAPEAPGNECDSSTSYAIDAQPHKYLVPAAARRPRQHARGCGAGAALPPPVGPDARAGGPYTDPHCLELVQQRIHPKASCS